MRGERDSWRERAGLEKDVFPFAYSHFPLFRHLFPTRKKKSETKTTKTGKIYSEKSGNFPPKNKK